MSFAILPALLLIAAAPEDTLTYEVNKTGVLFKFGAETVCRYNVGDDLAKPYVWPLNAPGGKAVTRPWPMVKGVEGETTDHVHQKSAWFCHGDVIPEGLELKVKSADKHVQGVDFWSEAGGHGKIVCTKVENPRPDGNYLVSFATKNVWKTADDVPVLDEARTITVRRLAKGNLIVFEIELAATYYPITFGDTKEGAMGVRVPDGFRLEVKDGGKVTSSDGKTAIGVTKATLPVWGQPADWHDYSGKVGDATAGIAVFDDAKNPHRALWHTRAYGLMAANPFGRDKSGFPAAKGKTELVKLPKGEKLKLRYAIYAHTGDAEGGDVAKAYETFGK